MSNRKHVVHLQLDSDAFDALTDLARLTSEAKQSIARRVLTEHLQSSGYAHLVTPTPTRSTLKKEKNTND